MSFPAIYQFICHSLSAQPAAMILHRLKEQLLGNEIDTMRLATVLGNHLITPAFYLANCDNGLIHYYPTDFRSYLENIYELNVNRNQKIKAQLLAFLRTMEEIDVDPLVLKGALTLLDQKTWNIGERIIGDIDVLIQKEEIHLAVEKLHSCGYQYAELEETYPWASTPVFDDTDPLITQQQRGAANHHHISPLSHAGFPACVELHYGLISTKITQDILDGSAVLARRNGSFPSVEDRVLHNFMHTQIQDRNSLFGRIELRQMHDLVKTLWASTDEIDWREIQQRINHTRYKHSFISYLQTADELFGLKLPRWVQATPISRAIRIKQSLYYKYGWCQKLLNRTVLILLKLHKNLSPSQIRGSYAGETLAKTYARRLKELLKRATMREWWAARLAEFGIKFD